ncbi:MAG: hypothetical protein ABR949_10665 [Candidatus Aquilonibacter sp.]|jgi:hypothetical protein
MRALSDVYRRACTIAIGAVALVAAVSCGPAQPQPLATSAPCTVPAGTQTALFYPAPNSWGAGPSLPGIYLASTAALPKTYSVDVVSSPQPGSYTAYYNGVQTITATPVPPATYGTPVTYTPPPPTTFSALQVSSGPGTAWPTGDTLYVYLANSSSQPQCIPLFIGSFVAGPSPTPAPTKT